VNPANVPPNAGDQVTLNFNPDDLVVLDGPAET